MIDIAHSSNRLRRIWTFLLSIFSILIAFPSLLLAEEEKHHSWFAWVTPKQWRDVLYARQNWGELDLIANTVFVLLVIVTAVLIFARRLEFLPQTRSQNLVEWFVEWLGKTFGPVLGENGLKYLPLIGSFFLFILIANLAGFVPGMQAPTAELNTTLALGTIAMVSVQFIGIKEAGFGKYVHHLIGTPPGMPLPLAVPLAFILLPIELLTQVARVVSLSLRLFANIYAKEVVLGVLFFLATKLFYIPVQLPVLFIGLLASLIQAFIFSILTCVYIAQFVSHAHEEHGHEAH